jgi:hypothetical protein
MDLYIPRYLVGGFLMLIIGDGNCDVVGYIC